MGDRLPKMTLVHKRAGIGQRILCPPCRMCQWVRIEVSLLQAIIQIPEPDERCGGWMEDDRGGLVVRLE